MGCSDLNIEILKMKINNILINHGFTNFGLEWVEKGEIAAWFKGGVTDRKHVELWNNGCVTAHYDINIPHEQDPNKTKKVVKEMQILLSGILKTSAKISFLSRLKRFFKRL